MQTRWGNGLHSIDRLRGEMDRLFEGVAEGLAPWTGLMGGGVFPALNVWEDDRNLYVEAELPGLKMEDLELMVSGGELTIKGERKDKSEGDMTYHRRERGVGPFTRVIRLPIAGRSRQSRGGVQGRRVDDHAAEIGSRPDEADRGEGRVRRISCRFRTGMAREVRAMTEQATITQKTPQSEGSRVERTRAGRAYLPNVDIVETKDELRLLVDVPGASAGDIDIHFEKGELEIHAKVPPRTGGNARMLLQEYGVGDFHRVFEVSETVDASRIQAECRNGVLTLHLPKVEAAKPHKIIVKTG